MFSVTRFAALYFALSVGVLALSKGAEAAEPHKGHLVAGQQGNISAQMTGERSQRVKEMRIRVGDRVKKGDVLARLDTEQLEADRLIAQRALEEARAYIAVAKADVARAKLDFERQGGLKNSPSFNRAGYENSELSLQAMQGKLENAESIASRREAEVARIDVELRLADIIAPYDGLVVNILTTVGASVTQTSPELLTLQDLSQVEIALPISKSAAADLKLGQNAAYVLGDGKRRQAQLRAILPPANSQATDLVARFQLDNASLPLVLQDQEAVDVYIDP